MNRNILIIIFLSFGVIGCTSNLLVNQSSVDAQLREKLVGSWVCDVGKDKNCIPHKTKYRADGIAEFYAYMDKSCSKIVNETKATWKIKDGHLIIEVQKSQGSWDFEKGYITDDEIVAIDKGHMILAAYPKGYNQFRLRSENCV